MNAYKRVLFLTVISGILFLSMHNIVFAHCDTLSGPVISDARQALEKGDVTAVLKWVKPERETEIKLAFEVALKGMAAGGKEKEKAEMDFFETVARIHREGEGEKFTGIKPETAVEPVLKEADSALEQGSTDNLIKLVNEDIAAGIRRRFDLVEEKKQHKDESVKAGREFVQAYVDFMHYVEDLDKLATKK